MIIDFHTHAFPDTVAAKAIPALAAEGKISAHTTGTIDALIASMDRAGIDISVVCSIATRPSQFEPILAWSKEIRSPRIIPLPSIHPTDTDVVAKLLRLKAEGFSGIKMHPYYQDFFLDEKRLIPLYKTLSETGLFMVVHCGYDIAFPRIRRADPSQILSIHQRFPDLHLITTHFGGWNMWGEVEKYLIGREIYIEISFALPYLSADQAMRMLTRHPSHYLLFGSDSPWEDQRMAIERLQSLNINDELFHRILGQNSEKLLL